MPIAGIPRSPLTTGQILAAVTSDTTKYAGATINSAKAINDAVGAYLDFWSLPIELTITSGVNTTRALSDVVIPNITGKDIEFALAMINVTLVEDTSGAKNYWNRLASVIQVNQSAAGWVTCITPQAAAHCLGVVSNGARYGGLFIGNVDISARVTFNVTTNFQWFETRCLANNLIVEVVSGVRIFLKNP